MECRFCSVFPGIVHCGHIDGAPIFNLPFYVNCVGPEGFPLDNET